MDIRCFFGRHDYEPFGDGVRSYDIIERSARINANAFYIPESKDEIYNILKLDFLITVNGSMEARNKLLNSHKIRDGICLRCGKLQTNIQRHRTTIGSKALAYGRKIKLREDRKKRAIAILEYRKNMAKEMLSKIENCI